MLYNVSADTFMFLSLHKYNAAPLYLKELHTLTTVIIIDSIKADFCQRNNK